jgi:6-phosphogluconolactonase
VEKALADVTVVSTAAALAEEAAQRVLSIAAEAIGSRGRFTMALAGGTTPRGLYLRLAAEPFRARVDWARTWIFQGDERCVPPSDPESNYLMAYESLLSRVPVPPGQLFRIHGEEKDSALAAAQYESELRTTFAPAPVRFDLILLGMGVDGHVASLFPGSPALGENDRLVTAVEVRAATVALRITMTLAVLNAARHVLFLVAGPEKVRSLTDALRNPASTLPAARVRPTDGTLHWLVDRAAATSLL